MIEFIIGLLNSPESSTGGAILIAAGVAAVGLVASIIRFIATVISNAVTRWSQKRATLIDLAVYARFTRDSAARITGPEAIEYIIKSINNDPIGFRPFGRQVSDEQEIVDSLRQIRRQLSMRELVACDNFMSRARLFVLYYEHLSSQQYLDLPPERKKIIWMQFVELGIKVGSEYDNLTANVSYVGEVLDKAEKSKLFKKQKTAQPYKGFKAVVEVDQS